MSKPIHLLLIEDSEDDVWLIINALRKGGYIPTYERVDNAAAMSDALAKGGWDVIISDYRMPGFNAPSALKLLKETQLDIPFIVVSGVISEDTAVAVMRDGAHDYLMKDNLTRLSPAVERELLEAANRRERRSAEQLSLRLGRMLDNSSNEIYVFTRESKTFIQVNRSAYESLNYSPAEMTELCLPDIQPEMTVERLDSLTEKLLQGKTTELLFEAHHRRKDGGEYPVEMRLYLSPNEKPPVFVAIARNISDRKSTENTLRYLAETGTMLSSSLDYEATLANVVNLTVPTIADLCVIDLLESNGLRRVAVGCSSPLISSEGERGRYYPLSVAGDMSDVIMTGQSIVYVDMNQRNLRTLPAATPLDIVSAILPRSLMFLPLSARGQVFGVLTLAVNQSRPAYSDIDQALGVELARRVSLALDNARLYREKQSQSEQLQVTLSSIGDGVIATDDHYQITFMNGVAEKLTGWTAEFARGQELPNVFQISESNGGGNSTVLTPHSLHQHSRVDSTADLLLMTPDGASVPVEYTSAPIHDEQQQFHGIVLVFRDITRRKTTERALKATLDKITDLYQVSRSLGAMRSIPDVLDTLLGSRYLNLQQALVLSFDQPWREDFGERPTYYEVSAIAGDGKSALVGKRYDIETFPFLPLLRGDYSVNLERLNADAHRLNPELVDDGPHTALLFSIKPRIEWWGVLVLLFNPNQFWSHDDVRHIEGMVDQVLIAIDNILLFEAEAKARAEAEIANELKMQFLAMVSHELRTPLTSIKGFTTTLLAPDVTWDRENQVDFLNVIDQETDKLTDLIDQLLDLSRLQAGTLRITPAMHDLGEVVEGATRHLEVLTRRHDLRVAVEPELPPLMLDAQRISQVIENLVANAAKYSPPQSRITIQANSSPVEVQIRVLDEGSGIPADEREEVFQPFRQSRQNHYNKGAGLGLAICKGLVEAHGGRIWIEGRDTGGTVVTFTIPLRRELST